jgi:hypothetical protein
MTIAFHINDKHLRQTNCVINYNNSIECNQSFDQKFANNETTIQLNETKAQNNRLFNKSLIKKKYKLIYSQSIYESAIKEIEILKKIKPYFEIKFDNKIGFNCKLNECKFRAKTLKLIEIHLRIKHFIFK